MQTLTLGNQSGHIGCCLCLLNLTLPTCTQDQGLTDGMGIILSSQRHSALDAIGHGAAGSVRGETCTNVHCANRAARPCPAHHDRVPQCGRLL
ncbi:MAG TPA: hypothetical protein VIL30_05935 [Ramlibacter sp.]